MWGRRAYLSLGGAVAAMLVAAGCGDEESTPVVSVTGASGVSGVGGSQALTKPAFIKQADAICAEANSAIADLGETTDDEAIQVSQELEISRSELESLQALTPPDQDRATLSDFLTALKNEVDALTRASSAAAGGDTSAADAELATAKSNAQTAATEYGFRECGNVLSQPTPPETPTTPTATTPTTPVTPTTTTPTVTTVPTPTTTPAPPSGGTAGAPPSGGTGGGGGDTGGGTGSGGTGGVSP